MSESPETKATTMRLVAPGHLPPPAFYANFVQVGISPHDFVLHFSSFSIPLVSDPEGEVAVPVQHITSVAIPLNLVRGLLRALNGQAQAWERAFGQPLPEEPKPQIEEPTET